MAQQQTRTADKSTARLVLWTLAETSRALSLDEIVSKVVLSDEREVNGVLDDLEIAGMVVHRHGRWAISAGAPGASIWAESFGDEAFDRREDTSEVPPLIKRSRRAREAWNRADAIERLSIWAGDASRLFEYALRRAPSNHDGKLYALLRKAFLETQDRYRADSLVHWLFEVFLRQDLAKRWPATGKSSGLGRRALNRISKETRRRESAVSTATTHMKSLYDTLGSPPGWVPSGDPADYRILSQPEAGDGS